VPAAPSTLDVPAWFAVLSAGVSLDPQATEPNKNTAPPQKVDLPLSDLLQFTVESMTTW